MSKYYDTGILERMIVKKYPTIRETSDYEALTDRFMDYTQSCTIKEQRDWMDHYMGQAIKQDAHACRLASQNKQGLNSVAQMRYEAALQFIVAYDLRA